MFIFSWFGSCAELLLVITQHFLILLNLSYDYTTDFYKEKCIENKTFFNTELAELCLQRFFINTAERKYSTATHLTAIQDKGVIN